jgi:hypothetical protein
VGRSGECFHDDQAPCLHGLGGLVWMWRPGVVMSDAAEPVWVHALRVVKAERLPSPTGPGQDMNCP